LEWLLTFQSVFVGLTVRPDASGLGWGPSAVRGSTCHVYLVRKPGQYACHDATWFGLRVDGDKGNFGLESAMKGLAGPRPQICQGP